VLKFWHAWGTFYLTISFAGVVGYFHSLAGGGAKRFFLTKDSFEVQSGMRN
jgi:hypothetical protein